MGKMESAFFLPLSAFSANQPLKSIALVQTDTEATKFEAREDNPQKYFEEQPQGKLW